jgi:plastocyanin
MDRPVPSTRRRRWLVVGAALMAVTMAMAACGDDDSGDESTDAAATGGGDATLEVVEFEYTDVEAPAGGALEIVNTSGGPHTFTADDGSFDEPIADGETVTVQVPDEPGDHPFHCEIHPSMTATLTAT